MDWEGRLIRQGAVWPWRAAFPLILTFSLGEKETGLLPAWKAHAAFIHPAAGFSAQRGACLPLPEGEGRGEG